MRISDWSSDVCSSDLGRPGDAGGEIVAEAAIGRNAGGLRLPHRLAVLGPHRLGHHHQREVAAGLLELLDLRGDAGDAVRKFGDEDGVGPAGDAGSRSEGRRVGKEGVSTCRSRWSRYN